MVEELHSHHLLMKPHGSKYCWPIELTVAQPDKLCQTIDFPAREKFVVSEIRL